MTNPTMAGVYRPLPAPAADAVPSDQPILPQAPPRMPPPFEPRVRSIKVVRPPTRRAESPSRSTLITQWVVLVVLLAILGGLIWFLVDTAGADPAPRDDGVIRAQAAMVDT